MSTWEIRQGDALERLREMPDESVQCCVTSPPYFGLRDYGTGEWEGGEDGCDHKRGGIPTWGPESTGSSTLQSRPNNDSHEREGWKGGVCGKCGATLTDRQLGLESTPDEYVARLVEVFREVRRVLRDDGTLWLNIGDSYNSSFGKQRGGGQWFDGGAPRDLGPARECLPGLKPKDLLMIPAQLALALRADGWYLRSEIIWAKPNPMPESVTDRPTSAHEKLFLLAKSARYFYDADAIREPDLGTDHPRAVLDGPSLEPSGGLRSANGGIRTVEGRNGTGRNKRNVWEIATQPYAEAHFACVDEATDCLTAEGWKRHDELRPGTMAAQFDMESQTLSWAPIQDVARYDVADQEMVVGQRRDMSMVLTPNHRCVIQRRHPRTRQHQAPAVVRADGLLPSHTIPTAAPWASSDGDTSLSCEWAELLGWYIAEGAESRQTLAVEIYQSESANAGKVRRIEALLRQVGAEWTSARATRRTDLPQGTRSGPSSVVAFRITGYAAVRLRELAPAKRIPPSALLWSQDRIRALFDGLIDGDGHRRPDGRLSFVQKDAERASMVQALALRLGLSAHLSMRPDGINVVYLTKHRTRSFRGAAGQGAPLGRMRYSGVVWCPRLPAGTWVARRDGKPFITGNTFPCKLVEPCILAGSSPKACGECGAPWTRVTDVSYEWYRELKARNFAATSGNMSKGMPEQGHARKNVRTTGWQPSCAHNDDTGRSVILDPFAGSGTTGLVALRHDRSFIGIELSAEYVQLARRRIQDDAPLLNTPAEVAAA